jgi:hypothetical protein
LCFAAIAALETQLEKQLNDSLKRGKKRKKKKAKKERKESKKKQFERQRCANRNSNSCHWNWSIIFTHCNCCKLTLQLLQTLQLAQPHNLTLVLELVHHLPPLQPSPVLATGATTQSDVGAGTIICLHCNRVFFYRYQGYKISYYK